MTNSNAAYQLAYPKRGRRPQDRQRSGTVPDWLLTFADMVTILLVFFILLISYSVQDEVRISIVSSSMKDAFGKHENMRKAAVIEHDGRQKLEYLKNATTLPQDDLQTEFETTKRDTFAKQGQEANTYEIEQTDITKPQSAMLAAYSIRQALQSSPDLAEISKNIIFEETEDGVNIQLVDQSGKAMFPQSSKFPYKHTQKLLELIARNLSNLPHSIVISGHSTPAPNAAQNAENWQLTADRANVTRALLEEYGVRSDQIAAIIGKADSEPLFPSDPHLSSNRRVTIMLLDEAPAHPVEFNLQ